MLLVIDIGNTNTVIGVFQGENLKSRFRVATDLKKTSDELVATLFNMLLIKHIDINEIEDSIISCVVPDVLYNWQSANRKLFDKEAIIVSADTPTFLKIDYENPREVGADRIVDAVAAASIYEGPLIVIDMGTAITFDVITEDKVYLGGSIAPGIRIAQDGLFGATAKLPKIKLSVPESAIGKNTPASINSGIIFGYIGMIDHIIATIEDELEEKFAINKDDITVVSTGGFSELISAESKYIDKIEPDLMINGLRIIYESIK
ncbi:MAG: type III pantothenate kinase [Anaerococcus sp.]|nr:type III pantothenate kinase [Anaerococcus sp.]